jgi:hypothetical protein
MTARTSRPPVLDSILRLPEELLLRITEYTRSDFRAIKNLRETRKPFARIGAPFAFEVVHIALVKDSLRSFIKIASDRDLASYVKELAFFVDLPPKYPNQEQWESDARSKF